VEVVTQFTVVTPEKNKAGSKMTRESSTWVIKTVCVPWNETNRCEDMITHRSYIYITKAVVK